MEENIESKPETNKNNNPELNTNNPAIPNLEEYINEGNDLNDIPRETIMNIYGNDFENLTSLIDTQEKNVNNYFISINKQIHEKYNKFHTKINSYLKCVTNKITDSFRFDNINELNNSYSEQINIQNYSKDYIKRIQNIIDIQNQILESIKETVNIFLNFLDIANSLNKEKPINDFVNKEFKNIINSWLYFKLNLEKFDFAQALNASGFDFNFKNFTHRISEGKNFVMNISLPRNYFDEGYIRNISLKEKEKLMNEKNKNKKILRENFNNLVKLKMNNIIDVENYFDEISDFNNMKSLKLKNVCFKNINEQFLSKFKNINKLKIINARYFESRHLENLSQNLTVLSLSNNDLVDFEFNNIMNNYLKTSNNIRNNLVYLSFSGNNLSYIKLDEIINQKTQFFALKNIDFSKNSIFKIAIPFEFFPELKCVNLCYNNFSKDFFTNTCRDKIVLQSGNLFLSNLNLAKIYYNDLVGKLDKLQVKLIYLNLSFIPNLISNDYFSKIKINETMLLGLKKIDFSYNKITNETFFNFIKNNKGMLNLKSLNLKGNNLDDLFFENYLNLKLNDKFTKLKKINLEENLFGDDNIEISHIEEEDDDKIVDNKIYKIRLLYKFISENKSLIKMTIAKNEIFKSYEIFDIFWSSENIYKMDSKGNIIINCLNSFLLKLKNEILMENEGSNNDYNRNKFDLKFDCQSGINLSSEDFTSKIE